VAASTSQPLVTGSPQLMYGAIQAPMAQTLLLQVHEATWGAARQLDTSAAVQDEAWLSQPLEHTPSRSKLPGVQLAILH